MMLPDDLLLADAERTLAVLRARGWLAATAESCTGGLIAACLTAIAGSSDVVDRGFVTYSNAAKSEMLGIPAALIAEHGAVSAQIAGAMAEAALARSRAEVTVAVTGIAGPGGASPGKPVGLVWFGCARHAAPMLVVSQVFGGDRNAVRAATVAFALALFRQAATP